MRRIGFLLALLLLFLEVDRALETVDRILHAQRNYRLADKVNHSYDDKFGLANLMTNVAVIAQMDCLERMGLTVDVLQSLDKTKATTLRFEASEKFTFLKEEDIKIPTGSTDVR